MRLFVAIDPPDDARQQLAAASARIRRQLEENAAPAVRWVAPAQLHVTLWFLGQVDGDREAALGSALSPPFGTVHFRLEIDRFGVFPSSGPVRVLWAGAGTGADSVLDLHAAVGARLAPLGILPEAGRFSPCDPRPGPRSAWGAAPAVPRRPAGCRGNRLGRRRGHAVREPAVATRPHLCTAAAGTIVGAVSARLGRAWFPDE